MSVKTKLAVAMMLCAGAHIRGEDGFFWADAWWAPSGSFTGNDHYWENATLPSGDGIGYYLKTQSVHLNFASPVSFRGLDFCDVHIQEGRPQISGTGLTMTGDAFIAGTGSGVINSDAAWGEIGIVTGTIHGTGDNSFSKRDVGTLTLNARLADFGTIVASGGMLVSSAVGDQLFATGNPSFAVRGGIFRWAPSLAAGTAGTASLGATTYGIGEGVISWGKGSGASATLTLDSLTSEGPGSVLVIDNDGGPSALGESEKLKINTPPALVNGILDPGIVTRDKAVESWPVRFTAYDEAKGVIPYPASSMKNLFDEDTDATDVAVVNATNTLATSTQVAALMIENSAGLTIAEGATLTVGDGNPGHQAGVVFNMQSPMGGDTPYEFTGAGTLDFGNSPGLLWSASPTRTGWGGNRRLYLKTKITGQNGVTLASYHRDNKTMSAGIFFASDKNFLCWNGPTRVKGCILWITGNGDRIPSGDVYVTEGSGWGGQFRVDGALTFDQNLFLSGRGTYGDGDSVVYLQGGMSTFNGVVTLFDDVTITCAKPEQGGINFTKGVNGPGGIYFKNGGTFIFNEVNTFDTLFTKKATTIKIGANGTFGTGMVWNKNGALTLNFDRRSTPLQVTNVFRVADGASISASFDNASVGFAKDVPFKNLDIGNFSAVSVGGVLSVDNLRGVGARDTTLGNFGKDEIVANSNNAELRMNVASDAVLGLPVSDGTGKLSLTKTGAGTLSLPRVERTYTGATAVKGGTLKLDVSPFECSSLQYWLDAARVEHSF